MPRLLPLVSSEAVGSGAETLLLRQEKVTTEGRQLDDGVAGYTAVRQYKVTLDWNHRARSLAMRGLVLYVLPPCLYLSYLGQKLRAPFLSLFPSHARQLLQPRIRREWSCHL